MIRILTLVSLILLAGCSLVSTRQKEVAAQASSDLRAATGYIKNVYSDAPAALAADAIDMHAANMEKALGIEPEDLPRPRIDVRDWQQDPNRSHQESRSNAASDSTTIGEYGVYAVAGVSIAILAGRLGTMMFANHPVGAFLGTLAHMVGGESPMKGKVYKKMLQAFEDYKTIDPDWKNNKLYQLLSDRMTTPEKDFIKTERSNV